MFDLESLVWVTLRERDDFLKVKETLTRIGVASERNKTLYQSCHILHKQGRYAIVHFKEMYMLDGKPADFTDEDKARRNTIANLLHDWELLDLVDEIKSEKPVLPISMVKIISHKEKNDWNLVAKYTMSGDKRKTK